MHNDLLNNLSKIHTTGLGADRIRKNLELGDIDVEEWCREHISSGSADINKAGKNWYVRSGDVVITVNAGSYTIITAHKADSKKKNSKVLE